MPVRFRRAFVWVCVWTGVALVQAQTLREYQAKGAFLVNFARFIEWPDDAFDGPAGSFDLCVVGERWMYEDIETTVKSKLIGSRPLRLRALGETTGCHMLFVGGNQPPERFFQPANDLTVRVGEQSRFLALGGHINFHLHGDRVHFEIAAAAAQQKKFRVSSKLLVLADKE